ncbi:uncharacterized transposon-derived protein F54H12.3 [Trichonephila inaurata madagascariensis]|uniref:Uncharacterized transposon-derived protein F54H12.3 n=1 Tax=Trichonephila inaurata madagascariensis TaxID=2747483 RepID=A0A8X6Y0N8_9ARAC|nr:uncharacterized transposon-derived protein F54H12.3 [Trichonephila inaurata madagascariensis]
MIAFLAQPVSLLIKSHPTWSHTFLKKVYGYDVDISYKFNVDDQVRISKTKKTFRRGYLPNWSDEMFAIDKRFVSNPPTYVLKDLKGETLKSRFYESELQRVSKSSPDTFTSVEKVLRTKRKRDNKEFFVKWRGFDNRFNSWVKAKWMKRFQIST